MTDQAFDSRRLKIEDVERELRRRLQKFCAPETVLDRGPRGGSNIIDRVTAIDPATASVEEQTDLREWTPIIARVRLFLAAAKVHRNNIFALNDEEKIKAYDLSRGWPDDTDEPPEAESDTPDLSMRLPDPISLSLEARVTTQAEEVKPTEGDIHADEYDLHEDEPEPTPLSIDDLISSGTMLTEDEYAMRVGILSGKVEQYAQQRIASRYDANARADIQKDFQTYIHKGALGLPITPAEDAAYQRANEKNAWIHAQETHARQLRESLPTLPLAMLRAYKLEDAGWPE